MTSTPMMRTPGKLDGCLATGHFPSDLNEMFARPKNWGDCKLAMVCQTIHFALQSFLLPEPWTKRINVAYSIPHVYVDRSCVLFSRMSCPHHVQSANHVAARFSTDRPRKA